MKSGTALFKRLIEGDAALAADLASQVGRRTQAKVISVDYRLAPEDPYPAAVDDALAAYEALLDNGTAPSDIAFAGESAGGGLVVATLVNARDHGLPLPAAAFVMSPYVDLTLAGATMETKREADPLMSLERLQARVPDYVAGQDAALGLISPIFADLSGLPPLIIQAGTHEVLLDDAVRLAQQAATADVPVTIAAVAGVEDRQQGLASGLLNTTQQVGGALGLAPLSTVAFTQINDAAAASGGQPSLSVLTNAYADAFLVGSGIALLGFFATLVLIRSRDSRAHVELGEHGSSHRGVQAAPTA